MTDPAVEQRALERRTLRLDMIRAMPYGFVEAAGGTLFLIIALKALDAGGLAKSFIAGATNAGLLLTPWVVTWAARRGGPATRVGSVILAAGAAGMAVALTGSVAALTVGALVGFAASAMVIPLITTVYLRNYPEGRRGRYVSFTYSVRVSAMLVSGLVVGRLLDRSLGSWRWVVVATIASLLLMAAVMWRIPSQPMPVAPADERAWDRRMALLRSDRLVRHTLTAWMLMGFANLMMLPLRVEYLGNPDFGVSLKPSEITLLTIVIPAIVRLSAAPLFGWIFDRMPFFVVRVVVNIGFALSIAVFFVGTSWPGLVVGAVLLGLSSSAGDILWNLWATKFTSSPQVTADVMSLHTFTTGIRGVLAPFAAFWLIARVNTIALAMICALMIVASSAILVPELRAELSRRRSGRDSVPPSTAAAVGPG
jgi:MFS family permease